MGSLVGRDAVRRRNLDNKIVEMRDGYPVLTYAEQQPPVTLFESPDFETKVKRTIFLYLIK